MKIYSSIKKQFLVKQIASSLHLNPKRNYVWYGDITLHATNV